MFVMPSDVNERNPRKSNSHNVQTPKHNSECNRKSFKGACGYVWIQKVTASVFCVSEAHVGSQVSEVLKSSIF